MSRVTDTTASLLHHRFFGGAASAGAWQLTAPSLLKPGEIAASGLARYGSVGVCEKPEFESTATFAVCGFARPSMVAPRAPGRRG